ncbi:hypothetical protein MBLNU230_g1921t1 [Neophaeotheca triangularis]
MKITKIKGLEVTIETDGAALPEHDVPDDIKLNPDGSVRNTIKHRDSTDARTQYVEVTPGSKFSIVVAIGSAFEKLSTDAGVNVEIYCDGKSLRYHPIHSEEVENTHTYSSIYQTIGGERIKQSFAFGDLTTHEDTPDDLGELLKYMSMGTIVVELTWATRTEKKRSKRRSIKHSTRASDDQAEVVDPITGSEDIVPEKGLKGRAISNHVILQDRTILPPLRPSAPSEYTIHYSYPQGHKPFATFTFRYRSRADLQREHVIPRDRSPTPPEDRDPENLTLEELREQVRLLRQRVSDRGSIKRERSTTVLPETLKRAAQDDDDDEVTIVENPQGKKRRRLITDADFEAIDLLE